MSMKDIQSLIQETMKSKGLSDEDILKAIYEDDYDYNVRNFKNQYLNTSHTEFKVDRYE